jgi:hypothetical protein
MIFPFSSTVADPESERFIEDGMVGGMYQK